MSDMLEQAIIDAEALKEAAVKNAETLVLEKYSGELKKAVETLLEQEDPLLAGGPEAPGAEGDKKETSSVMEHVPLSVMEADNDKQVEIPLDGLLKEISNLSESLGFGGDVVIEDMDLHEEELFEYDIEGLEEADYVEEDILEDDLFEYELEEAEGLDEVNPDRMEEDVLDEYGMEEDVLDEYDLEEVDRIDLEEGSLYPHGHPKFAAAGGVGEGLDALEEAILERLKVDVRPVPGRLAMSENEFRLAEEELLALEQDSDIKEENEALRSAVKELKAVNETITKQNKKLTKTLNESATYMNKLRKAVNKLDEKLDKVSLDKARLLYQNKALTSDSLNERQKQKLAEAVVNAETIEEAKIIFETLQNTVGSTSRKKQPNSLSEAVQKPSSMILSARESNSGRQKRDPTLDRWKFLAGIDKTN